MAPSAAAASAPIDPAALISSALLNLVAAQEGWSLEEDGEGGFRVLGQDEDTGNGFLLATARPVSSGFWVLETEECSVEFRVILTPRDPQAG
jgi:hypothetical protein